MISIKKLVLITLIVSSALTNTVFAQGSGNKYAGEFLAIGVGGRPLGMGGAYVALANDVTAGYWNPALLSKVNYPQIALMHDARFNNLVNYDYGSIGIPFGKNASFGLSIIRMGIDDIPDTRNAMNNEGRLDYDKITMFSSVDYAFLLTYAKKQNDILCYGANLKIIKRDIAEASAWGLGFDVGIGYSPINRLLLGANLMDLTTTYLSWSTGKQELITPTAKIGAGYSIDFFKGTLTPALDFDVRFENRRSASNFNIGAVSFDMHGGLEYDYQNIVAIRGGYNEIGNLTLGAGVKLPKLNIDYSFVKFDGDDALGNTHRISIMFTLEEDKFMRKK